jgi:hypothetical protein
MPPDIANNLKMAVLQQDRAEVSLWEDSGFRPLAYTSLQLQQTIDLLRQDIAARNDVEDRNDVEEELAELVKEKNILEDLVVSTQA